MKSCKECNNNFSVTDQDRLFYAKMNVPEPTLCSFCRQQRRLAFRNERTLYKRKCSGTGKDIISIYPPDTPWKVYDHSYFGSDKWNALDYGREFDFSKPFFEQFHELLLVTPRMLNYSVGNENAEYGNLSSWNKNCYMLFESDDNRDCFYCDYSYRCKNVVDSSYVKESELCYGCVNILKGYKLFFSLNCRNCSDSWFLENCAGCHNCFGCANIINKEYCFWNEQLTKEEYQNKLNALNLNSYTNIKNLWEYFLEFSKKFPRKYMHGFHNEDSTGDYLNYCKNANFCFDSAELRDCKFVYDCEHIKDGYDLDTYGGIEGAEMVYECQSVGRGSFNVAFSNNVWQDLTDVWYCDNCTHSKDLFGCISLRHKQYCILNKEYSKEDYFILRKRIVEHMQKTQEYGEFFPVKFSPFAYNETLANVYYPLTREKALAKKWHWTDFESKIIVDKTISAKQLPDDIKDTPNDIINWVIICETTGKPFKITPQELVFYQQQKLPIPHFHPDERYKRRIGLKNPRKLYRSSCSNCKTEIQTTYSPQRPEAIYCEKCYIETVY
ncbi:hypothetical protein HZC21_00890 [Candidatus Peregrinibacteria bacterium]|nr:hypothetical protein [Candidatus Peregrinibacteria bacterium]